MYRGNKVYESGLDAYIEERIRKICNKETVAIPESEILYVKTLYRLLSEDEAIWFVITSDDSGYFIGPDKGEFTDACMEDTVHRLIDAGFKEEIPYITCLKDRKPEKDGIDIDPGYAVSDILTIQKTDIHLLSTNAWCRMTAEKSGHLMAESMLRAFVRYIQKQPNPYRYLEPLQEMIKTIKNVSDDEIYSLYIDYRGDGERLDVKTSKGTLYVDISPNGDCPEAGITYCPDGCLPYEGADIAYAKAYDGTIRVYTFADEASENATDIFELSEDKFDEVLSLV